MRSCASLAPEVVAAGRPAEPRSACRTAFRGGRVKELNAIVHPAVIEAQRRWMNEVFARDPAAVAVVVSALIFEVERDARASGEANAVFAEWRRRIDRVVLVTAPDEREDRPLRGPRLPFRREQRQPPRPTRAPGWPTRFPTAKKLARADYLLENTGDIEALRAQVGELWPRLKQESNLNLESIVIKIEAVTKLLREPALLPWELRRIGLRNCIWKGRKV